MYKKLLLFPLLFLGITFSAFASPIVFENSDCPELENYTNATACLHLPDGRHLFATNDKNTYVEISASGEETLIKTNYEIIGAIDGGYFVIMDTETTTQDGTIQNVKNFGLKASDFTLLLEPILVNNPINNFYFDDYGIASVTYGTPYSPKTSILNENGELLQGYDSLINSTTENRYILIKNNLYFLVDSDYNIIVQNANSIKSVDIGKFLIDGKVTDHNGVATDAFSTFTDSSKNYISPWALEYMETAKELDIVNVLSYSSLPITRIEFCEYIINILKAYEVELPDVSQKNYFYDTRDENVLIAHALDIIDGVGNNNFSPYESLTREQAAKILVNLAELLNMDVSHTVSDAYFKDISSASLWSKDYILKISALKSSSGEGIMQGVTEDTFAPQNILTKEQALTSLTRFFN